MKVAAHALASMTGTGSACRQQTDYLPPLLHLPQTLALNQLHHRVTVLIMLILGASVVGRELAALRGCVETSTGR